MFPENTIRYEKFPYHFIAWREYQSTHICVMRLPDGNQMTFVNQVSPNAEWIRYGFTRNEAIGELVNAIADHLRETAQDYKAVTTYQVVPGNDCPF